MSADERNALAGTVRQLGLQMQSGNAAAVLAATVSTATGQLRGISSQVGSVAPLIAGSTLTIQDLYLLDASDLNPAQDVAQFYCGGQNSPDVSFAIPQVPAGRYALAFLHATGVANPQQLTFLLASVRPPAPETELSPATHNSVGIGPTAAATPSAAPPAATWKLAGLFVRPLTSAGHDGLWYWVRARDYAKSKQNWNAYFYYRTAESVLVPVDFLSSPDRDKLIKEETALAPANLPGSEPMTLTFAGQSYPVTALRTDGSLGGLDLVIAYNGTDNSDPAAARTRNIQVMRAMLKLRPEIKNAFHGLWVYSHAPNQPDFANELPMSEIP